MVVTKLWRTMKWERGLNSVQTNAGAEATSTLRTGWDSRGVLSYALTLLTREHILSLIDQGLVSGTSFLTTVLIARFSNAGVLGVYVIGVSVLISIQAFQDSLILEPYTIRQHSPGLHPADHQGASFIFSVFGSVGSALMLAMAASGALAWQGASDMLLMIFAIAAVLPMALTREFARRTAYAQLQLHRAVILDAAVALIQVSALVLLGLTGRMSALTACAALGGANGIVAAGWLCWRRRTLNVRLQTAKALFGQTWNLGKWLLIGRVTVQVQGYLIYWIVIATAGAVATGVLAACMSIVNIATPLLLALGGVMTPRSVLAWRKEGAQGLWREVLRNTALFGAVIAPFCVCIMLGGGQLMHWLYPGEDYQDAGITVAVLALATFVSALGSPAAFGLATMERPRAIVAVGMICAALSIGLVAFMMVQWGLLGAVFGLLIGNILGTVGRWIAFIAIIPRQRDKAVIAPVLRLLRQFMSGFDWENSDISWIGGGEHADVFKIMPQCVEPFDESHAGIVLKLYKPEAALTFDRVKEQFSSLADLHAMLDGFQCNGWRVCVPRPLYLSHSPLAFAMTAVPGHVIDASASPITRENIRSAARAFIGAMQRCWLSGQRHGDLGLSNVLFDFETRMISIIDPGTRESCRTCSEVERFPSALASDLAHALCDLVRDATDLTGRPSWHPNRSAFVMAVLAAMFERQASMAEKQRMLRDLWECFEEHLIECFGSEWSLRRIPKQVARIIARSRARSIIESFMSDDKVDRELTMSVCREPVEG